MDIMGHWATTLRDQRIRLGLTQREVAELAGVTVTTISNLERRIGAAVQLRTVVTVFAAVGLELVPVLRGSHPGHAPPSSGRRRVRRTVR